MCQLISAENNITNGFCIFVTDRYRNGLSILLLQYSVKWRYPYVTCVQNFLPIGKEDKKILTILQMKEEAQINYNSFLFQNKIQHIFFLE